MLKKIFYISIFFSFYFIFSFNSIKAKEYCYLYLDKEVFDTVELPFYFYELNRDVTIGEGMPIIDYNKKHTYVDSLTKCNLIEETISYNVISMYDAKIFDYSKEEVLLHNELHFSEAKLKNNNSIVKGLATKKDEEPPSFSGYEDKYTTNIDNPLDLTLLINLFSVYDNFDGNISNNIKIEYEEYNENKNKVGNYPVILSVEDSSFNKTTITFYIEVIDSIPPNIKGKDFYVSYLSNPLDIETIKSNLSASDNSNENLSSQIFACEDLYSINKNTIGEHYLYFCVYDNSNNLSPSFKVTVEVKDDIPPIIEGLSYYKSYLSHPLTIKEILYSLAASDNNQDITSSIFITNDYYSNYQNTIGEKTIYFQAKDEQNNLSLPFEVKIDLIDDIKPQIFGLNIFDSYLSNPLSLTYLKQQLTIIDNIDGNISNNLETINDSYSTNINNKGTYYITFQAFDSSSNYSEEFKITINNIDDVPPYFIGPNSLTYQLDQKPSLEVILGQYKVKDNADSNLDFQIIEDTYSPSFETGLFFISLTSQDLSSNTTSPFIIKIELVEKLITLNKASLYIPTSSLLPINEINKLINLTTSYNIIEDSYTNNYFKEGTYLIKYELEDSSLIEVTITTFKDKEEQTELTSKTKKETFITKIKRFFKKIFSFFKNLFNTIRPIKVYQRDL